MNENVNLYELMSAFWKENEYESFSPGQICLYFFLLNRANSRRWNMPIKCETSYARRTIGIPHSAVLDAREGLYRRGLIKFTNGSGRGNPPLYYLILDPKEWKELPQENPINKYKDNTNERVKKRPVEKPTETPQENPTEIPQEKITETPQKNPTDIPQEKPTETPQEKPKAKPIEKPIVSISESPHPYNIKNEKSNIKDEIEIDALEKLFLSDQEWQKEILDIFPEQKSLSSESFISKTKDFFSYLRTKGLNKREEKDCKKHFINWLKINLNKSQNGNQSSLRRPSDVSATSSKDYDGAF